MCNVGRYIERLVHRILTIIAPLVIKLFSSGILLQDASLFGRVLVGPQHVFVVGLLLFHRPQPDLVQPQFEAGSHLVEIHHVVFWFAIHVVPKGNKIIVVGKGNYTFGIVPGDGKEALQNVSDAFP